MNLLLIFAIVESFSILGSLLKYQREVQMERDRAELNATIYAGRIQQDLQQGFTITEILERILIDNKGSIRDFNRVAKTLMEDYVSSIQLAPEG